MRSIHKLIVNLHEIDLSNEESLVTILCKCGLPKVVRLKGLPRSVKQGCRVCSSTRHWSEKELAQNSARLKEKWGDVAYREKCSRASRETWDRQGYRGGFKWETADLVKSLNPMFEYIGRKGGQHVVRCKSCLAEKRRKPRDFRKNCSCRPQSSQESEIAGFVRGLGFSTERKRIGRKEVDIFIPELSVGIEYNSLYWHSSKFQGEFDHQEKFLVCRDHGVRLITVWEDQWIFSRESTEDYLRSELLGTRRVEGLVVDLSTLDYFRCADMGMNLVEILPPKRWSYRRRFGYEPGYIDTFWDCGYARFE